jgi:predicted nucleotidyltransferase
MVKTSQISPHLAVSEQAGLKTLLKKLREEYSDQVRQVILFGSKARNDSHSDSDLDLLVLVKDESWALRYSIWKLAAHVELEYDLLFNIQVISLERWQAMTQAGFSLCQNVAREGIAL